MNAFPGYSGGVGEAVGINDGASSMSWPYKAPPEITYREKRGNKFNLMTLPIRKRNYASDK